jgi:LytS/YehU family sensor histidine kinase
MWFEPVSAEAAAFINYPPFFMALGVVIELSCFALALAYRNRLTEQKISSLHATYTQQLEDQLAQRTQEVQAQSQQLEKQHIRQLELGFEQQLAQTEMTALRAQMNPHFIFNCLNSIKLYATENDAGKAADYLTKFSRLIRLVLENSRSERVTLQNELNALQLYLDMEVMRFKDKLSYEIIVNEQIDTEFVEIPPLLLQPYVENAIWHGLMHKLEGGRVVVLVEQAQPDQLQITITDDGIGRAKAVELKSKSAMPNKSFGMKVTSERIALINQVYQTHTRIQIHDLLDSAGQAAGTEVVLEIPV